MLSRELGIERLLLAALLLVVTLDAALLVATGLPAADTIASFLGAMTCLVCARTLRQTIKTTPSEGQAWRAFSRAGKGVALALLAEAGVGMAVQASYLPEALSGFGFSLGSVAFYSFTYQGIVRWHPRRASESGPGDWINGLAAGLATMSLVSVGLHLTRAPTAAWPDLAQHIWLAQVIALEIFCGAAATVAALGGPVKDRRLLSMSLAFGMGMAAQGVLPFVAGPDVVGASIQVVWVSMVGVLIFCSRARPAASPPPPALDSHSMVVGALVVLAASVSSLTLVGAAGLEMPFAIAASAVAALGSGTRLLLLVSSLSQLGLSQQEARTDELTGIPNRRALAAAMTSAVDSGVNCALLVVDLDRFKEINDHHGHAVGDEVLKSLAIRIQAALPAETTLGRLGGDEFAVLLTGVWVADATRIAWALAEVCAMPVTTRGGTMSLRASIGVATTRLDGRREGELMRRADSAMYVAKQSGGGVSSYDETADRLVRSDRDLLEELRSILSPHATDEDRRQIAVYYQPQLSTRSGKVTGAEALVRWKHPTRGLLSPASFLDMVERHGLMLQLTTMVARQALIEANLWHRTGHPIRLSLNLSPSVLAHPGLLALMDSAIGESHLDVGHVVLEITETTLMTDPVRALSAVNALAARGIGISIDDYGTGYSSLAYLHDLPAAELKLDRCFTARVAQQQRTAAIVASTIDLAHGLGLRLVAEGVEDEATLDILQRFGCDETQGFFHARPMPADTFVQWLLTHQPTAPGKRAPAKATI